MIDNMYPKDHIRKFADAHIHLTGKFYYSDIYNADILLACTARYPEWYELHSICDDGRIIKSYGIHPWYAGEWNEKIKEKLGFLLEEDKKSGVGEIGLDCFHKDINTQIKVFNSQLQISSDYKRIATVHMIGYEKMMLDSIKTYGKKCKGIILHAFDGPDSYIKPFSEQGCYFSINPKLLKKSEKKVIDIISKIPDDRFLMETDAPNQCYDFIGMN